MCALNVFSITEKYLITFWHYETERQSILLSVKAGSNWLLWSFP